LATSLPERGPGPARGLGRRGHPPLLDGWLGRGDPGRQPRETWVDLAEAIEAGEVRFDPKLAAECIAEVRDYPCDGEDQDQPACEELLNSLRTVGESCVHHWSCDSHVCRDGTCVARGQVGDECDHTEGGKGWLCEDELFCNNKGICVEYGQEGDPCDEDEEEQPCADGYSCQEDETCGVSDRPEGSSCADFFCDDDSICVCDDYNCGLDQGVCTAYGERGDSCGENGPHCGGGLRCADGECVPGKRAGEPCDAFIDGETCGLDDDGYSLDCIGSDDDWTCVPMSRAGEPCDEEEGPFCLEGFCVEGRCSEKKCHLYD
jgi:hypothetical protein